MCRLALLKGLNPTGRWYLASINTDDEAGSITCVELPARSVSTDTYPM